MHDHSLDLKGKTLWSQLLRPEATNAEDTKYTMCLQ